MCIEQISNRWNVFNNSVAASPRYIYTMLYIWTLNDHITLDWARYKMYLYPIQKATNFKFMFTRFLFCFFVSSSCDIHWSHWILYHYSFDAIGCSSELTNGKEWEMNGALNACTLPRKRIRQARRGKLERSVLASSNSTTSIEKILLYRIELL